MCYKMCDARCRETCHEKIICDSVVGVTESFVICVGRSGSPGMTWWSLVSTRVVVVKIPPVSQHYINSFKIFSKFLKNYFRILLKLFQVFTRFTNFLPKISPKVRYRSCGYFNKKYFKKI